MKNNIASQAYAFSTRDKIKIVLQSMSRVYKLNLMIADLPLKTKLKLLYLSKFAPSLEQDLLEYSKIFPNIIDHLFHMLCLLSTRDSNLKKIQLEKVQNHHFLNFINENKAYKFTLNLFPSVQNPVVHDLYPFVDIFYLKVYDYYPIKGKVVDIGGYVGDTTVYFLNKGAELVYVYEPNPYNYNYLLQNLKLNKVHTKVKPFQLAIAKDEGYSTFNVPPYMGGAGSMYTSYQKNIKMRVKKISCHEVLNMHINLLKMDCKGCEVDIICQCGKELQDNVDYIIYQAETLDRAVFNKLLTRLKELGFSIDRIDAVYSMVYASSHKSKE